MKNNLNTLADNDFDGFFKAIEHSKDMSIHLALHHIIDTRNAELLKLCLLKGNDVFYFSNEHVHKIIHYFENDIIHCLLHYLKNDSRFSSFLLYAFEYANIQSINLFLEQFNHEIHTFIDNPFKDLFFKDRYEVISLLLDDKRFFKYVNAYLFSQCCENNKIDLAEKIYQLVNIDVTDSVYMYNALVKEKYELLSYLLSKTTVESRKNLNSIFYIQHAFKNRREDISYLFLAFEDVALAFQQHDPNLYAILQTKKIKENVEQF